MRFRTRFAVAAVSVAAFVAWSAVYYSKAQVGASLPFVTGVSVPTSVTPLVAYNPSRRGLKICNVALTNDLWIAPVNATGTPVTVAANGAGSFLLSRVAAPGTGVVVNCLNMPADIAGPGGGIPVVPTAAFNGIGQGGTATATVWEY